MVHTVPGTEAWRHEDGEPGVLVLHGFTGNPVSLRPLAEALAAAGCAVELPRLPGHGTRWQDLRRTTWCDWTREAGAALERLRQRTRAQVAVGLSAGGAIALRLAQTSAQPLAGLVLINPSLRIDDRRLVLLPLLSWLIPAVPGIGNDIAKPGTDELPYGRVPLKALASLLDLQRQVRARLAEVRAPVLVFTSRQDHTVPPENSRLVLEGISSVERRQVWLEHSYHVATLDYDAPVIIRETLAFVRHVGVEV